MRGSAGVLGQGPSPSHGCSPPRNGWKLLRELEHSGQPASVDTQRTHRRTSEQAMADRRDERSQSRYPSQHYGNKEADSGKRCRRLLSLVIQRLPRGQTHQKGPCLEEHEICRNALEEAGRSLSDAHIGTLGAGKGLWNPHQGESASQ